MTCPQPLSVNNSEIYWNMTDSEILYHDVKYYLHTIIMPIILIFGILGNFTNILVFTRKKMSRRFDGNEKSATIGLVSLAAADMTFCIIALPLAFIERRYMASSDHWQGVAAMYYWVYARPMLNTFLLSSTWIIVLIGIERCLVVVRPLHSRWLVRVNRTILMHVCVYVSSAVFNLPHFFKHSITNYQGCFFAMPAWLSENGVFWEIYRISWTVVGTFAPFLILAVCNIKLILGIRTSQRQFASSENRHRTSKITFILITIIFLFLALVCPSQILHFFENHVTKASWGEGPYYHYRTAIVITNLTQAINFSINFLLYCTLSKPFRETVVRTCWHNGSRSSTTESQAQRYIYHMVATQNGRGPVTGDTELKTFKESVMQKSRGSISVIAFGAKNRLKQNK